MTRRRVRAVAEGRGCWRDHRSHIWGTLVYAARIRGSQGAPVCRRAVAKGKGQRSKSPGGTPLPGVGCGQGGLGRKRHPCVCLSQRGLPQQNVTPGQPKQQTFISRSSGSQKPKIKAPAVVVPGKNLLLARLPARRQWALCCVLTWREERRSSDLPPSLQEAT